MVMAMMLLVVAMFTITSLNDKYAVSKAKMNGYELTFLMASGTAVFLAVLMPFLSAENRFITLCPQTVIAVLLIALCKFLEFSMSAKILIDMSVFELKAWLGITLFMSYLTDVIGGEEPRIIKIVFILVTAAGLVLIARAGRKSVNYKKIALPLAVYLLQSYGYGFVINAAEAYVSSTMTLFIALIVLSLVLIPMAKPAKIAVNSPEGKKGVCYVLLSKLPNSIGLLVMNYVALKSMTSYAFIQPMILIVIFAMGFIPKKSEHESTAKISPSDVVNGVLCIIGIVGFQFC